MKHLISAFFLVILCLGTPTSYAQDNNKPTPTPLPEITKQNEGPAKESDDKEEADKQQTDSNSPPLVVNKDMSRQKVPTLSASEKIADKARFWTMLQAYIGGGTLVLAGLATWFAYGAWSAARKGVEVTRDAAKAEYRPYAKVSDITLHGNPENITFHDNKHCVLHGKFSVTNYGRSPIYTRSVTGNMSIIPRGLKIPHFNVSMGVSRQEREIARFNIPEGHGIGEADFENFIFQINTLVKFDDMFSISTPDYRHFRTEHNGIFMPVLEDGNNIYGIFDRVVRSLKIVRMDTYISNDDIHESKNPENQPKQKSFTEFLNEGNRQKGNDFES